MVLAGLTCLVLAWSTPPNRDLDVVAGLQVGLSEAAPVPHADASQSFQARLKSLEEFKAMTSAAIHNISSKVAEARVISDASHAKLDTILNPNGSTRFVQRQSYVTATGCSWYAISCWVNKVEADADQLINDGKKLADDVELIASLTSQLGSITKMLEKVGACIKNLPGGNLSPLQAIENLGKALASGTLPQYTLDTYIFPYLNMMPTAFEKGVSILKDAALHDLSLLEKGSGELDVELAESLPSQLVNTTVAILSTTTAGACFAESAIAGDFETLADLMAPVLKVILQGLMDIWKDFTGPGSLIADLVSSLMTEVHAEIVALMPTDAKIDDAIAGTIATVCDVSTNALMRIAQGAAEMPAGFCTDAEVAEHDIVGLITKPETTMAALMSAGFGFATDGAMRLPAPARLPLLRHPASAGCEPCSRRATPSRTCSLSRIIAPPCTPPAHACGRAALGVASRCASQS